MTFNLWIKLYGMALSTGYVVGSIILLKLIHSTFEAGFVLAVKVLWLPLGILFFACGWWSLRKRYPQGGRPMKTWGATVGLYLVFLLLSWPYVLLVNALTASDETMQVRGKVVERHEEKGRHPSYVLIVKDIQTGEDIPLETDEKTYRQIGLGDEYAQKLRVGGFGIPFRWSWQAEQVPGRQ